MGTDSNLKDMISNTIQAYEDWFYSNWDSGIDMIIFTIRDTWVWLCKLLDGPWSRLIYSIKANTWIWGALGFSFFMVIAVLYIFISTAEQVRKMNRDEKKWDKKDKEEAEK